MKKMLHFDMCRSVEVPSDFPLGLLYNTNGRKMGEVVTQMEASDLPESGALHRMCGQHQPHVI